MNKQTKTNQTKYPSKSILNPEFKYVDSSKVDIRKVFKRHGWAPLEKGNGKH